MHRAFLGAGQRATYTPDQPAPDGSARFAQWWWPFTLARVPQKSHRLTPARPYNPHSPRFGHAVQFNLVVIRIEEISRGEALLISGRSMPFDMTQWTRSVRKVCAFLLQCALGLLGIAVADPARPGQSPSLTTMLTVRDPKCVPGKCVCSGTVEASARLNDIGIRAAMLKRGISCIVADFDGNGSRDYAIPGAEGSAGVILIGPKGVAKVATIDAGGMLELYPPRTEPGEHGEPVSTNHALLVRWVGRQHAVFSWNGDGFTRTLFPAK